MELSRSSRRTLALCGALVASLLLPTTIASVSARSEPQVKRIETIQRSSAKERIGISTMTFTETATWAETRTITEE